KTRGLVEAAFAGDYHSVFKGRGMNFEDVREYQPGDEIRSIDWNVTARMGNAFVKKFTEERELTVMLVVDVSASGNFGSTTQSKRELAAEVACLLAFSAIRNNDKVGLILFTDRVELFIPPKKGRSHTLRLIREILFFEPKGRGTEPALALDYLNKIVTRRAVVFFISDFQALDFARAPHSCSMREIGRAVEQWSNEMNSPGTTPRLHYSIIPLLLAEEFHDIAPPVDYSLLSPWLVFLGMFVLLTAIGLIVWFVAKSFRRPTPPQSPRERALALLEQIRGQITAIDPYRFSIRVSD